MTILRCMWAVFFAALAAWGVYTSVHWYKPKGRWALARKVNFACDVAFTSTCLVIVVTLVANRFHAVMLAPLGLFYAMWLFLPCYFHSVNQIRPVRMARNALFAVIAFVCLAVATGFLSATCLGL